LQMNCTEVFVVYIKVNWGNWRKLWREFVIIAEIHIWNLLNMKQSR
jgi:hypothetical protein